MLRVSEIYPSIQGEGLNIGKPTLFVRFAGCNLKCPLWPCDTQHAIDPAIFTKDQVMMTPEDILTVAALEYPDIKNICLTGGEPMLQNRQDLDVLVDGLDMMDRSVEMFSNGTLPYTEWFVNNVTVCMDWKLRGSGDDLTKYTEARMVNMVLLDYAARPQSIKFTIASEADYEDAKLVAQVVSITGNISIYFGAVWGKVKESDLVNWMLNDGLKYKLNVQVHNYIWDRNKRGI